MGNRKVILLLVSKAAPTDSISGELPLVRIRSFTALYCDCVSDAIECTLFRATVLGLRCNRKRSGRLQNSQGNLIRSHLLAGSIRNHAAIDIAIHIFARSFLDGECTCATACVP